MSHPDFTKIGLGAPKPITRTGKAWPSPEGIDIKAAYTPDDVTGLEPVSYTHLTLPTKA